MILQSSYFILKQNLIIINSIQWKLYRELRKSDTIENNNHFETVQQIHLIVMLDLNNTVLVYENNRGSF